MSSNEPRTLSDVPPILDGEVIRHDWEERPRFYKVRFYPVEHGRVMVHVTLEADPSAFAMRHTDDDPACRFDAVADCIQDIADQMDTTWDAEAVGELEDRYASESRYWY